MFEQDFVSFLGANAGLTALLTDANYGRRIFPAPLPESIALPAVTFILVSQQRDRAQDGPSGLVRNWIQIDCWASAYADAAQLGDAVRQALDGFAGTMGLTDVPLAQLQSSTDFYEDARRINRRMLEFFVWFYES